MGFCAVAYGSNIVVAGAVGNVDSKSEGVLSPIMIGDGMTGILKRRGGVTEGVVQKRIKSEHQNISFRSANDKSSRTFIFYTPKRSTSVRLF